MHGLLSKKLFHFKERSKQRGNPASLLIELEVMEVVPSAATDLISKPFPFPDRQTRNKKQVLLRCRVVD